MHTLYYHVNSTRKELHSRIVAPAHVHYLLHPFLARWLTYQQPKNSLVYLLSLSQDLRRQEAKYRTISSVMMTGNVSPHESSCSGLYV